MSDETTEQSTEQAPTETAPDPVATWQSQLSDPALRESVQLQRYNTQDDANKAHLELSKNFSGDHVMWPKDAEDTQGWAGINKRLGVPDKAEGYELENVQASGQDGNYDRLAFQQRMKDNNIPKSQATALWGEYTSMVNGIVDQSQATIAKNAENTQAELRQEWGQEYDKNIRLGQTVIDSYSDNQDQAAWLTKTFADPNGVKFLAKIGGMSAEHNIEGFQPAKSFNRTPAEARAEIDEHMNSTAYWSSDPKISKPLSDRVIDLRKML